MKDYTLTQQFALIGLSGLDVVQMTAAKAAVLRGIAAAKVLEGSGLLAEEQISDPERAAEAGRELKREIEKVRNLSKKEAHRLEQEMREQLMTDGVLEEVQDLLACDMLFETAGVEVRAYRADSDLYIGIMDRIRAEVLEEGPVSAEAFCMIWLMRESGCMHDVFTVTEQEQVNRRLLEMTVGNPLYQFIWASEFHSALERLAGGFLKAKKSLFRNPYLEGVNLLFPFLDRRQAIFIDFVVLGSTVTSRRTAIMSYLSERGHYVQEVRRGDEVLLKIDNQYYCVFPMTKICSRIPIQGANLVPVYL